MASLTSGGSTGGVLWIKLVESWRCNLQIEQSVRIPADEALLVPEASIAVRENEVSVTFP